MSMSGEVMLAAAVVAQAVKDLEHGTPAEKRQAQHDVLYGAFEFWLEIVCEDYDVKDQIHVGLRRLCAAVVA